MGETTVHCKYVIPRLGAFAASSFTTHDVVQSVVLLVAHAYHCAADIMHGEIRGMFAGCDANALCVIESALWYLQCLLSSRDYPLYRSKDCPLFWERKDAAMSPVLKDLLFKYYEGEFPAEFAQYKQFTCSLQALRPIVLTSDEADRFSDWGYDWGYRSATGDCPIALVHRAFLLHHSTDTLFDSSTMYRSASSSNSQGQGDSLGSDDTGKDREIVLRTYARVFQSKAHLVAYCRNWKLLTHIQGVVAHIRVLAALKADAADTLQLAERYLKRQGLLRLLTSDTCCVFDPSRSFDSLSAVSQGGVFYFGGASSPIFRRTSDIAASSPISSSSSSSSSSLPPSADDANLARDNNSTSPNLIFNIYELAAAPEGDTSDAARKRKRDLSGLRVVSPYDLIARALVLAAHAYRDIFKMEVSCESQESTHERRKESLLMSIHICRILCAQSAAYNRAGEGSIGEVARPAFASYVGDSALHLVRSLKKYYDLTGSDGSDIMADVFDKLMEYKVGGEFELELISLRGKYLKSSADSRAGNDDTPLKKARTTGSAPIVIRELAMKPVQREALLALGRAGTLVGRVLYSLHDFAEGPGLGSCLDTSYGGYDVVSLTSGPSASAIASSTAAAAGVAGTSSGTSCVCSRGGSLLDVEELGIVYVLCLIASIHAADSGCRCRCSVAPPRSKYRSSWEERVAETRWAVGSGSGGEPLVSLRRGLVTGEVAVAASRRWLACHSERRMFLHLVNVFFADILFDREEEFMLTRPFETEPLDFCDGSGAGDAAYSGLPQLPYLKSTFHARRQTAVGRRIAEISRMGAADMAAFMSASPYSLKHGSTDAGILLPRRGGAGVLFSLKECVSLAVALRGDRLSKIMERVVREPQCYLFHGMPDLVFWQTSSESSATFASGSGDSRAVNINDSAIKGCDQGLREVVLHDSVLFVEVKSRNDKLRPHQLACLQLLGECGVRAEVLQVE